MKTALYDSHVALGAKMVPFSGWEMPLQYEGIILEHLAVRTKVGIFDVSHMGRIEVSGPDAERFLDFLATNHIAGMVDGQVVYTVLCGENGGSIDDVLIYREDPTHFFVVVNAGNREKDLNHLRFHSKNFQVKMTPRYLEDGILAIQGPLAKDVVAALFPMAHEIKPMHFVKTKDLVLSRTGYTGADGFEVYGSNEVIKGLWESFLELGVKPVGLGARDTLRLEKGYALYGHELSDTIAPTESVAKWTVKGDKDFLGRKALEELERSDHKRSAYGAILIDPGIAREGYEVYQDGEKIGSVTSGTMSPTLHRPIALILVNHQLKRGDRVDIKIRDRLSSAEIVSLPFF
jgi:aminomethyltransferase